MLFFLTSTAGYIETSRSVTLTAVGFHHLVTDIDRVDKVFDLGPFRNIFLRLTENAMAQIAIL